MFQLLSYSAELLAAGRVARETMKWSNRFLQLSIRFKYPRTNDRRGGESMGVGQMRGGIYDGRIENSVSLFHCRVWVVGELETRTGKDKSAGLREESMRESIGESIAL